MTALNLPIFVQFHLTAKAFQLCSGWPFIVNKNQIVYLLLFFFLGGGHFIKTVCCWYFCVFLSVTCYHIRDCQVFFIFLQSSFPNYIMYLIAIKHHLTNCTGTSIAEGGRFFLASWIAFIMLTWVFFQSCFLIFRSTSTSWQQKSIKRPLHFGYQ